MSVQGLWFDTSVWHHSWIEIDQDGSCLPWMLYKNTISSTTNHKTESPRTLEFHYCLMKSPLVVWLTALVRNHWISHCFEVKLSRDHMRPGKIFCSLEVYPRYFGVPVWLAWLRLNEIILRGYSIAKLYLMPGVKYLQKFINWELSAIGKMWKQLQI